MVHWGLFYASREEQSYLHQHFELEASTIVVKLNREVAVLCNVTP